ncbi:MAG: MotA/TolQ/ExbB proton channel family protein [Bacillota bacterium]
MLIPGSEYLSKTLHVIAQSLLIPCIIGLIIMLVQAFLHLGGLAAEHQQRRRERSIPLGELLNALPEGPRLPEAVMALNLPPRLREVLSNFTGQGHLPYPARRVLAENLLAQEELWAAKVLEKTDLIVKLGPILGLMGTLIPLGPGLAALGQGDINALAQAVVVAFDTTVAGVAAGGIAYLVSKVRRRWYAEHLNSVEALLDLCLGGETNAAAEPKKVVFGGRRP